MPVFLDVQSIEPGQQWKIEINAALDQCKAILVFWCEHAAESSEVRSEYERAISRGKHVVPVLIDHTALPPDLGRYQAVPLQAALSKEHERLSRWAARRSFQEAAKAVPSDDIRSASQQLASSLTATFGDHVRVSLITERVPKYS